MGIKIFFKISPNPVIELPNHFRLGEYGSPTLHVSRRAGYGAYAYVGGWICASAGPLEPLSDKQRVS